MTGTTARHCTYLGCLALYDATGVTPVTGWRQWPALPDTRMCPDHSPLWDTHQPTLVFSVDRRRARVACQCGWTQPGPGSPTLGKAREVLQLHLLDVTRTPASIVDSTTHLAHPQKET